MEKFETQILVDIKKYQRKYRKLEIQKYMVSPIFSNKEVNLLHSLWSRTTDCEENFKQKYINSNLLCILCQEHNDDQQHVLRCRVIQSKFRSEHLLGESAEYENIFSEDVNKQKEITALYLELFKTRSTLHNELSSQPDPSTADVVLTSSDNLLNSIVHLFSGK